MKISIGIDVGGVIRKMATSKENDLFYTDQYLNCDFVDGAIDNIKILVNVFGAEAVFLISKQKHEDSRLKTLAWFDHNDFYDRTSVLRENVLFCTDRKGKADLCKQKGITHFIDDRSEVLKYVSETVPNLFLFQPKQYEIDRNKEFASTLTVYNSWVEIVNELKKHSSN